MNTMGITKSKDILQVMCHVHDAGAGPGGGAPLAGGAPPIEIR